ncbi:MAG: hypothetical protein SFX73_25380 [Kofleriaceae bacterium]|nr:hypothetical protein [Kofleriaceae bacterium]
MLNTKPPGKRTGYSNPDCYANTLDDCCSEINQEHYISKKLLKRLGRFEAEGFAWRPKKGPVGLNLQARILCERHNTALSPLDAMITDLYDLMRAWQDRKELGERVLDGEDLERWALKALCGLVMSGGVRPGRDQANETEPSIPRKYARILFGEAEMPKRWGFRTAHAVFGHLTPASVRCRVDWRDGVAMPDSIVMSLVGFTWSTTLAEVNVPPGEAYRPSDFAIGETGRLTIRWNGTKRKGPQVQLFEKKES